jgi:ribosome-binding factor A
MASSQSRRRASPSRFPRTARVNEVLREVIASDLERYEQDDPRLELVTVTAIEAEPDFRRATVYFSALATKAEPHEVIEALEEKRTQLQAAVARSVRLKRTPQLLFQPDAGITGGQRVEEILRSIQEEPAGRQGSTQITDENGDEPSE